MDYVNKLLTDDEFKMNNSDDSLYYPYIREFMYSFLLSYRHVVSETFKAASYRRVGMKSGSQFNTFFMCHSKINHDSDLMKYPASLVHLIFEYMSNSAIYNTIENMLLGRSIVFVADNPNILTDIMNGFLQLLHPL